MCPLKMIPVNKTMAYITAKRKTPTPRLPCLQPLGAAFNKMKHDVLLWGNYDFPLICSNSNYFWRAQLENCSHIYKKHVYFEK